MSLQDNRTSKDKTDTYTHTYTQPRYHMYVLAYLPHQAAHSVV